MSHQVPRKHLARRYPLRAAAAVAIVAAVLCAAAGTLAVFRAHASVRPIGKLSPAAGAYWGVFTSQNIANRETQVGRKFAIHQKYYDWTNNFPAASEADDAANGRVPLDTWQPQTNGTTPLSATADADIAAGKFDATIVTRAQAVKNFGHPIFLRFGAEMNGNWELWNGTVQGNTPADFVAAWRHVHDVFVAQGATNAVWVWCPSIEDVPVTPANHWTNYYPGDNYVDWVGIDGYNWGTTQTWSSWQSFTNIFGNGTTGIYGNYAATKPIMIAETASAYAGAPAGTSKAQWITDMATAIQSTYPSIEALVWFDTVSSTGTGQWPIDTSPDSLAAYTAAGQLGYFSPPLNLGKTGDLNLDGTIDTFDLSIMLANWGATNNNVADLNHDGHVNIYDLSLLLKNWGS